MVRAGIESERVFKVREGRPDIVDHVRNGRVQLMINTPHGRKGLADERAMRLAGLRFGVPCITTPSAATAVVAAIRRCAAPAIKLQDLQRVDRGRRPAPGLSSRRRGLVPWRRCSW